MGSVIARDLARSKEVDQVLLADLDPRKLDDAKRRHGNRKFLTEVLDVTRRTEAVKIFREFNVVAAALPHGPVHAANLAAVAAGAKMVDVAFEDAQMRLDEQAKKTGALLIPGCGVAPGLSGILVAFGSRQMGSPQEAHIAVGGIPQKPTGPLGYRLVFSMKGLLREYLTKARIMRNGKVRRVDPFERVDQLTFPPPVGTCEGFYTDGLGTLLYSMPDLLTLDEMTVRWPGHAEKIKFLIDADFFSEKKIRVSGNSVKPSEFSAAILTELLARGSPEDVTVMTVTVKGQEKGREIEVEYEMVDFYDEKNDISSMGRTTGYTCAAVARMVGTSKIRRKGVVPPEVALDEKGTIKLLSQLSARGVKVRRRNRTAGKEKTSND
jgi:lysine 6-dehydrogenase